VGEVLVVEHQGLPGASVTIARCSVERWAPSRLTPLQRGVQVLMAPAAPKKKRKPKRR